MRVESPKLAANYIKHDREVPMEHLTKYGKFATHDLEVPVLLAYELGTIPDKNGTMVKIDKNFINTLLKLTNEYIHKKHKNPFAIFKKSWNTPVDQARSIPLIKNHDTSDVDNTAGHIRGLLYTEEVEGILSLWGTAVITQIEDKIAAESGKLNTTSLGTRADGSIKEVSFVINEAIQHGGLAMSEFVEPSQQTTAPTLSQEEIALSEQIQNLQLEEHQLTTITIPNHITLSRMIRTGRIEPWKYDDLIKQNPEVLQLMEHAMPSNKLGIVYGTNMSPQKINPKDASDAVIEKALVKHNARTGKTSSKDIESKIKEQEIIRQGHSFEEVRKKELEHILELAEYSPEVARKYIAVELGESITTPGYQDKYLTEYLNKSKELKQKLNNLQIQLGEFKNDTII